MGEWRTWRVVLTHGIGARTVLMCHARTEHAAMVMVRYVIDAEARGLAGDA